MRTKKYFLLPVLACVPLLAVAAESLESFAGYEEIKDAVISPDGRYLALISTVEGRRIALVRDLQSAGKASPVMTADASGEFDLDWCRWANPSRLLCGFGGVAQIRQISFPSVKLAGVDADGKNFKELVTSATGRSLQSGERGFDPIQGDPQKILARASFGLVTADAQPAYIYTLDVNTGKVAQITTNILNRQLWNLYSDGVGNLTLADSYGSHRIDYYGDSMGNKWIVGGRGGDEQRLFVSKDRGNEWSVLNKASAFSKTNPFSGLGVLTASTRAYGFADHEGRSALWEFDLDDKNPPVVGFAHPQVDVNGVLLDGRGQLIGVQYDTDRPHVDYIDPQLATTMRGINKALPNTFNSIRSITDDHKKLVIVSRSDTDAGRFQLYDVETRKLIAIGAVNSSLDAKQLARMRSIEYPAADGTKIPGYLLAPQDRREEKLPLIVMPHSGYEGRAYWRYDMIAQFLVSRGYAVIAMNYRGSEGYGKQWLQAGQEDWGGLIYSDITDAARWAVSQGIADPQRICVLGRGASSYAALLGAIRNSDIYKCVASMGGRSDLVDFNKYMRNFSSGKKNAAAEAHAEKKENKEDSPQKLAGDVKVPVLLIHGTLDTKTPLAQSEDMAKALERAGKKYKFVKIERADFNLWRQSERVAVLKELEEFFGSNLRL